MTWHAFLRSQSGICLLLFAAACGPANSGASTQTGGTTGQGTGGSAASGGSTGTGGSVGSGGTFGTGGAAGTGGGVSGSGGLSGGSGGTSGSSGGAPGGGGGSDGRSGGAMGNSGGAGGRGSGGAGGRGSGGAAGSGAGTGGRAATGGAGGSSAAHPDFTFFVASVGAMRTLSGNEQGFGGDLRYGETGTGAGLRGADKICSAAAERAWPGTGSKAWRAFLSTTAGGANGGPVHARDRVGTGPWHDALGRLVASNLSQLLMDRPGDADATIKQDLPNEYGIPNHTDGAPGCTNNCPDNHDVLTGTGTDGMLYMNSQTTTCSDWTSSATAGSPRCGHSWPRTQSGTNWMSSLPELGCAPAINLSEGASGPTRGVGSGGGYGAIYCFVTNAP